MSAAEGSKPTPGPWVINKVDTDDQTWEIDAPNGDPLLGYDRWSGFIEVYGCDDEPDKGRLVAEANASLIAEAGAVHHETGKTPRQLQDALSVSEQERSALAEDNAALRLDVEGLRESWDSYIATVDSLRTTIGVLQRESGDLRGEVERLKGQADEARGLMSKHRGNAVGLHMAMWGWAEQYDAALAEQQQTAGERA